MFEELTIKPEIQLLSTIPRDLIHARELPT